MTATELMAQAAAAAEAADLGTATARKTGRDARWPYVPVVRHNTGGLHGDGYDEQLQRRAYATRDEAVQNATDAIAHRRATLAEQLVEPRMRALREQHGLPRELAPTTVESEPEPRLVNCYPVHDVGVGFSGVTYRQLGGCCGDPVTALADAMAAGAEFLLIYDVRTYERWYVDLHQLARYREARSIAAMRASDDRHRAAGDTLCWCNRWVAEDDLVHGTCGAGQCLRTEGQDRAGLIP